MTIIDTKGETMHPIPAVLLAIVIVLLLVLAASIYSDVKDRHSHKVEKGNSDRIAELLGADRKPLMHWHGYVCGNVLMQDNFTNDPGLISCPVCKSGVNKRKGGGK
jgi:hypothetical protein